MEAFNGVISRSIPYFSVAGVDNHHHHHRRRRSSNLSFRSGFSDQGHVSYYHAPPRCGGKKEKEKGVISISTKKKMKLLKGLRKDLSMFSEFGFRVDPNSVLAGEDQGKIVSEAADALLKQFQQLRAEEKELKKKKKLEKAQLKAARMRTMPESLSSSSESSDSECGEVVQMSRLKKKTLAQPILRESQTCTQEETPVDITTGPQECNPVSFESSLENRSMVNLTTSSSDVLCDSLGARKVTNKIEVCMGGKCKKSGGAELMEEFERVIGVEGSVVGCKCMGKCKDGPNVRVLTPTHTDDDSVRTPVKSMCVGVGLADVGLILANFLGEDQGFTPATA